jgi:hypothetical protein
MAGGLPKDRSAIGLEIPDIYREDFASLVEMPCKPGDWNDQQNRTRSYEQPKSPPPFFTVPNFHETHSDPNQGVICFNNVSPSQFAGLEELSTLGTSSNPIYLVDSPHSSPQSEEDRWSAYDEIPSLGTSSNPINLVDSSPSSPPSETCTFQNRHTRDEISSPSHSTSQPNPMIPDHEGPEQSADEIKTCYQIFALKRRLKSKMKTQSSRAL